MRSIYLPAAEDTQVSVTYADGKDPIVFDLLQFDELVSEANESAKESGQHWLDELARIVNKKFKVKLSKSQVYFLYLGNKSSIEEIKKKLFGG